MNIPYDDSRWPLVVQRWEGILSDADLEGFLSVIDGWLARGERFGLLVDSRGALGLSPEQRNRLLQHMRANDHLNKRFLIQAVVIDNLVQRTLFFAVNWLFRPSFPNKVFAEVEPAEAWLKQQLGLIAQKA